MRVRKPRVAVLFKPFSVILKQFMIPETRWANETASMLANPCRRGFGNIINFFQMCRATYHRSIVILIGTITKTHCCMVRVLMAIEVIPHTR
jgi:hypothetical protein